MNGKPGTEKRAAEKPFLPAKTKQPCQLIFCLKSENPENVKNSNKDSFEDLF